MIKIVESKAFVLSLLTLVAAVAGYEGLNLPVATIMGLLTPLMIAIGAAGWSDAVRMKAKMALEHDVKMHALMHGNSNENGVARDAEGRIKQAGFARVGVMALIASVLGFGILTSSLLATNEGCGAVKPVVTDVIQCVAAESVVVSDGYSILQIASAVWSAIESGPAGVAAAIEKLITQYGPDVVACAIDNYPESTPTPAPGEGSGSGSGSNMSVSVLAAAKAQRVATKHELLAKYFPGKKINHGKSK